LLDFQCKKKKNHCVPTLILIHLANLKKCVPVGFASTKKPFGFESLKEVVTDHFTGMSTELMLFLKVRNL